MKTEPQKETITENPGKSGPLTSSEVALPTKHRLGPWRVLRNRNYSLLFWGELISSAGTQMQVVAVAWQVYLLTHSAIALGLIGLVQAIPRLIFSLVGGVFADVFDRRKLLIVIEIVLALTSAVLALCTVFHVINIVIIYIVVLIAASAPGDPGCALARLFRHFLWIATSASAGLCKPNYAYRPARAWNFNSGHLYWCSSPGAIHGTDWTHYPPGSWSRTCDYRLGPM